jgi:hypothetical protein
VDLGKNVLRSADGGATWTKHAVGAEGTANQGFTFVNGEFWLPGLKGKRSKDGLIWKDLPNSVPRGQIYQSNKGTLICITGTAILRNADGAKWDTVFTPGKDALGRPIRLQVGAFGLVNEPRKGKS